jgi:hypothetical protein
MERNGSDVRRGSREHAAPPALTASFVASARVSCLEFTERLRCSLEADQKFYYCVCVDA